MIERVRGFRDIFGEELEKFNKIREVSREVLKAFNYKEVILPVVEYEELYKRSIGDFTDVVEKEMFSFTDKGGRRLALRPEGTAGVVRFFIENKLYYKRPYSKLFYEGPMFRYERPQKGRYRQFYQVGAEFFGVLEPISDLEIILISEEILKRLKVSYKLHINSIGCRVCRPKYLEELKKFLREREGFCKDCQRRREKNPLRVLDCKEKSCQVLVEDAPKIDDYLCKECKEHYQKLKELLGEFKVEFYENPKLVRGLDYYTKTVFEFEVEGLTVLAGGRYDYLVEELGGIPTPAVGFALGIDRLVPLIEPPKREEEAYLLVFFGNGNYRYLQRILNSLKPKKFEIYPKANLKKALSFANKEGFKFVVIIGEDEVKGNYITIKDMQRGEQKKVYML